MARFASADDRIFTNVWICMKCNAKNRVSSGKRPERCRKCNHKRLRLKRKVKKAGK